METITLNKTEIATLGLADDINCPEWLVQVALIDPKTKYEVLDAVLTQNLAITIRYRAVDQSLVGEWHDRIQLNFADHHVAFTEIFKAHGKPAFLADETLPITYRIADGEQRKIDVFIRHASNAIDVGVMLVVGPEVDSGVLALTANSPTLPFVNHAGKYVPVPVGARCFITVAPKVSAMIERVLKDNAFDIYPPATLTLYEYSHGRMRNCVVVKLTPNK